MMSSLLLAFVQALLLPILTTELLNLQFPIPRTRRVGLSRSSDRIQVKTKKQNKLNLSLSPLFPSIKCAVIYFYWLGSLYIYYIIISFDLLFYFTDWDSLYSLCRHTAPMMASKFLLASSTWYSRTVSWIVLVRYIKTTPTK